MLLLFMKVYPENISKTFVEVPYEKDSHLIDLEDECDDNDSHPNALEHELLQQESKPTKITNPEPGPSKAKHFIEVCRKCFTKKHKIHKCNRSALMDIDNIMYKIQDTNVEYKVFKNLLYKKKKTLKVKHPITVTLKRNDFTVSQRKSHKQPDGAQLALRLRGNVASSKRKQIIALAQIRNEFGPNVFEPKITEKLDDLQSEVCQFYMSRQMNFLYYDKKGKSWNHTTKTIIFCTDVEGYISFLEGKLKNSSTMLII